MPIGMIPGVLRGIFNLPSAISQEGIGGVPTAFFNPQRVESQRRVGNALEENQPEEKAIDDIIHQADSPDDLAPAFDLYQQLQHHAVETGLVNNEAEYNQVLAPVMNRLGNKARSFITGDTGTQARGTLALGTRLGSTALVKEGSELSKLVGREGQNAAALALAGYRQGQTTGLPAQADLDRARANEANAGAAKARKEAENVGQPKRPTLPDVFSRDQGLRKVAAGDPRSFMPGQVPPGAQIDDRNLQAMGAGQPLTYYTPPVGGEGPAQERQLPMPVENMLSTGALGFDTTNLGQTLEQYPQAPTMANPPPQSQGQAVPSGPPPQPVATPGASPAPRQFRPQPPPAGAYTPQMPAENAVPADAAPQGPSQPISVESVVPQDKIKQTLLKRAQQGDQLAAAMLQLMGQGLSYSAAKARVQAASQGAPAQ